MAKSSKVVLAIILGLGIFAGGYFWGVNARDKEPQANSAAKTGEMQGMESIEGMPGMSPGMVMVSQQNQQLLGIKTAAVERRGMAQTIRTVGSITYDETRVSRVHSKIDGWVEKLYVNYTGKLVKKASRFLPCTVPTFLPRSRSTFSH